MFLTEEEQSETIIKYEKLRWRLIMLYSYKIKDVEVITWHVEGSGLCTRIFLQYLSISSEHRGPFLDFRRIVKI